MAHVLQSGQTWGTHPILSAGILGSISKKYAECDFKNTRSRDVKYLHVIIL